MDSGSEDSDSDLSDMDSDSNSTEVDLAHAARAALLVARFAAAIQATKQLQALQNRLQPRALETLVFKCLYWGDVAFLKQKRLFRMMPGRLMEMINRKLGPNWRRPPLAGVMANPRTRHLSLDLMRPWYGEGEDGGWSLQQLEKLCEDVARECKTSLLSLEINSWPNEDRRYPGLHPATLGSLLLELRALTSLHVRWDIKTCEADLLVSILASTNPDIRSLRLPNLSNKSLRTIADGWPQLEFLAADKHEFDSSQLEAVLPRLRNLRKLRMKYPGIMSTVMMSVARAHDPASPPYKLTEGFDCSFIEPVSSGDMIRLFTAFPALYWLTLLERHIPAVCAGLEGREHVHITKLVVWPTSPDPRALEPLLALVGKHVIKLQVNQDQPQRVYSNRLDLNMIGHYCPKLQELSAHARHLVSSDEFGVTDTYFSELKRCSLSHNPEDESLAQLPVALVSCVLASPTLNYLVSSGVPITEEVVAALAEERGALSSLEKLFVRRPTQVGEGVLARLVSLALRLGHLTLSTEEEQEVDGLYEMRDVLRSFVHQSGLKPVSFHLDLP